MTNVGETRATVLTGKLLLLGGSAVSAAAGGFGVYRHVRQPGEFTSTAAVVAYVALTLTVSTGLLAALRLRPVLRARVGLVVASTGATLYAGEVYVDFIVEPARVRRASAVIADAERAAGEAGVPFDRRSPRDVVSALRARVPDAVPAVGPITWLRKNSDGTVTSRVVPEGREVLPLSGIPNRLTVLCNETGEYLIYRSDEFGFHNPPGVWKTDAMDIVVLGDSYAQGACVSSDANAVALVRQHYPRTLNLGVLGSGPLVELAILREYGARTRPRIVLWFYYEGNDLDNLRVERRSALLMRYLRDPSFSQGLEAMRPALNEAVTRYVEMALQSTVTPVRAPGEALGTRILRMLKLSQLRLRTGLDLPSPEIELFKEILVEAQRSVEGWGGRLVAVYLPAFPRYKSRDFALSHRDRVLTALRAAGIPTIDVHPAFKAAPDPLVHFPFRRYGHYSPVGYRVVAEEILRAVGPLPSRPVLDPGPRRLETATGIGSAIP